MMAKHTRGNGTVYPRGNVWWLQYFLSGRHINESSGSTDEAEARRQLKVKVGGAAAGNAVLPGRATISDLCALVMDNHRLRELHETRNVQYQINAHVQPILGTLRASRFGPAQARQYILQRQAEGASNATINRELAVVRRGFRLGYEAEPKLVFQLPMIHKLPETNVRQGFLEPDQYERVLEELPGNLKALFVCGYHTGAPKGELGRIQWPQVDFAAGLIRLSGNQTKNKRPRTLPIYGEMRRWLEHQRSTCPDGCPWVFHGAHKRPVDKHLNGWVDACKRAGMPGLLFHDLRRSAVRNMKKAGLQDLEAMRITGHLTRHVFDRYNIIDEDDLADAGKRLDEYAQKRRQERAARLQRVK
jgi:integrase